jgi:hypothetical protein
VNNLNKWKFHSQRNQEKTAFRECLQNFLSSSSLSIIHIKIKIYKNIILPVVLYWCETWLLMLGEESKLRVFENRVLRRVFGLKGDEVTGEWWSYNEGLNDLYSSPNIIWVITSRRMRCMENRGSVYGVLVWRHEGRRPL